MKEQKQVDICILGAGLAGLTLALQIKKRMPERSILIVERRTFPAPEAAFKIGESTVEIAAHYFANILGLKSYIEEEQLPKLGLRYFFPSGKNEAIETRLELGGNNFYPTPSYQLDRGRFENHLHEQAVAQGIEVLERHDVQELELDADSTHKLSLTNRQRETQTVEARWLIDATGRTEFLKHHLKLHKACPHKVSSVWFRLKTRICIDDWSSDSAWRRRVDKNEGKRWLSTNHLMGEGYWVWLIPLSSGSTSVGIVADTRMHPPETMDTFEQAVTWLHAHEPQCGQAVEEVKSTLQDFAAIKNFSHSAESVFSEQRWCLTGEAGLFPDPFYSPGSDFIAISNSYITELIYRDYVTAGYETFAPIFNGMYYNQFNSTLSLFRDQYPLFGNATVMPLKVIWDFAYYWTIPAFFFLQGQICNLKLFKLFKEEIEALVALNLELQQLFRDWHELPEPSGPEGMIDITKIPFMLQLNQNLQQAFSSEAFSETLRKNLKQLHQLAAELKAEYTEQSSKSHVPLPKQLLEQIYTE